MSFPDSGPTPGPRDPAPRKPVRPSIRPFTRTLLDKPFQPFEMQLLQRMLANEQDFRIFCMFGRPICGPMAGCERPVVIRGRAYDSRVLRTVYLGTALESLLTSVGDQTTAPAAGAQTPDQPAATPEPPFTGTACLRSLLRPLLRDALLLEVASSPRPVYRLDHIGQTLATLSFEHFSACPDPASVVSALAQELVTDGLLGGPSDIVDVAGMPMFALGHMATPRGKAHVAGVVMPRWASARVRRTPAPG
ncbi:MAG: hypothetical protein EBQ99_07240 [Planctomycetes bacterium]|nr:hypothetical protein [Planctomycetota bacterium]